MTEAHQKPDWAQSKFDKANADRVAQGQKPRRRWWRWVILAVLVVGAVAYFMLQPAPPAPVEEEADAGPVAKQLLPAEVSEIEPQQLVQTVKVTGTLVPGRQSEVSSQASGPVLTVNFRPGETVSRGDILVEIDPSTLQLQLDQQRATADATRAQLVQAQQAQERTEELASGGLASPSTLEQARSSTAALQANLAALESAVQTAQIARDNATVRASFDGVVSARSVEPGTNISAGTPLFTIVNLDDMEFQAAASVNNSALVAAGQMTTVTVTGIDGRQFTGEVTRVNPVAQADTRRVPIYVNLDNHDGLLRGGMFATGLITVAEAKDAIAVPDTALREDAEGPFVLTLGDGELVRTAVEPGQVWDRGRIIAVTGLDAGATIVSAPLSELMPGDAYQLAED